MKKSFKSDKSSSFYTPKQPKIPILTHSVAEKVLFNAEDKDKSEKRVNVICPNCQFHFKIELKLFNLQKKIQDSIDKPQSNLQRFIEHEFSLISNYSRQERQIQNSPIIKLKKQEHRQTEFDDFVGLDRLQRLNQLSLMQKSRLQESKITVRFNPSPQDSPIEQYKEQYKSIVQQPSPPVEKRKDISQSPRKSQPQMGEDSKLVIRQKIYDYFEMVEVFTGILDWICANEHYSSLPSYLRLLISTCQDKLDANGFR